MLKSYEQLNRHTVLYLCAPLIFATFNFCEMCKIPFLYFVKICCFTISYIKYFKHFWSMYKSLFYIFPPRILCHDWIQSQWKLWPSPSMGVWCVGHQSKGSQCWKLDRTCLPQCCHTSRLLVQVGYSISMFSNNTPIQRYYAASIQF